MNSLKKTLSISFVIYLFALGILIFIMPDKVFSELENRTLAQKPKFNTENIQSGKFAKGFEEYVSDQFPFRDQFIAVKTASEILLQKKDSNGVYIGSDGYLLQKFETPDLELLKRNIGYINKFSRNFNVSFMLVPTATKVLEEKLPLFATPYDEIDYINDAQAYLEDNIKFVNVFPALEEAENEYIFYKTDHHWTTLGAYYAYQQYCLINGIEPMDIDSFDIVTETKEFYGSLFSKGNFTFAEPDELSIFYPKKANAVTVEYIAENKSTNTMYEKSHLEKKDKYSVFLDNNHPAIKISTSIKNGKKLMVIKDSYANCFIPFLANHYEEIYVMDLRFLNISISDFANTNGVKDVLLLYNVQNFAKETSLSLLK